MVTRAVLGWGKPIGYDEGVITSTHAIVGIGKAFVTACSGSWLSSDEWEFFAMFALDLPTPFTGVIADLLVARRCYRICSQCCRELGIRQRPSPSSQHLGAS